MGILFRELIVQYAEITSQKIVIEKLRGRENYETWKIAAQSYLTINGYWSCTKATVSEAAAADVIEKHEKAQS